MSEFIDSTYEQADALLSRMSKGWKGSVEEKGDKLRPQLARMFENTWEGENEWGYTMLDWWMYNYASSKLISRQVNDDLDASQAKVRELEIELDRQKARYHEAQANFLRLRASFAEEQEYRY